MVNGYFDAPFWKSWNITPYVGGGIGADYVHQSITVLGESFDGTNTGFAWQVMAGLHYFLVEDLGFSVEYKFHRAPLQHGHYLDNQSVTFGFKKFYCL